MIGKIQDVFSAAVAIGAADVAKANTETTNNDTNAALQQAALTNDAAVAANTNAAQQQDAVQQSDAAKDQKAADKQKTNKLDEKSVSQMTKELNKLMSSINCDLEFQYHKEVNVMSVKMVDKNTQEVIKEYPPEDMIKGMIKAREWIGAFLDRNA